MSAEPLAVVTADLHLDAGAWRRHPDLRGDSHFALSRVVDLAIGRGLPVLALGDLFDVRDPESSDVDHFLREVGRLHAAGLDFLFTQGQHEKVRAGPAWAALACSPARHVHRQAFTLGPVSFFAHDHTNRPAEVWPSVPADIDVLLMHQVWVDLMGEHLGGECRFADVPHARMLITGDYHRHLVRYATGAGGQPLTVLSPGSTSMRSIDEPPEKFVFVLGADLSAESVPLPARPCRRFACDDEASFEAGLAEAAAWLESLPPLPPPIDRPLVEFTFPRDVPRAAARLQKALGGRVHLMPRVSAVRRPAAEASDDALAAPRRVAGTLNEHLSHYCEPTSETYDRALRLLRAEDVAAALEDEERRYLTGA